MTEVVRSRRIGAGADDVWAVLADFGAIARWAGDVDHACLMSDQTEGVGATRRVQTGRTTLVERVIDWAAPSTLAYEITGLPPVVRSVVNRWTIEPADDDSVTAQPTVTVTVFGQTPSLPSLGAK